MSDIKIPPREAYEVKFPFRCAEHADETAEWTIRDMLYKGSPICGECGDDMTLVPADDMSERKLIALNEEEMRIIEDALTGRYISSVRAGDEPRAERIEKVRKRMREQS